MKKKVPNIIDEKLRLAKCFKIVRPKVTESIHMQAALVLNCSYKTIEDYLSGIIEDEYFALQLIEMLGHLISIEGDEDVTKKSGADLKSILLTIGEMSQRSYRETKSTKAELVFLETRLNKRFEKMQYALNEITRHLEKP